jgi:hypothetical protein
MSAEVRVDLAALGEGVARLHGGWEVIGAGSAIDGSHQSELVHHGGLQRQMFANSGTRDFRRYRSERAAKFARRVGLRIPRVKLTGATGQPNEDHCLAARTVCCGLFGPAAQQGGQRQSCQPGQTRL